jgi:hypothetical protein
VSEGETRIPAGSNSRDASAAAHTEPRSVREYDAQSYETATERGDRIEAEAVKAARPILRRQSKLMLGLAGRVERDRAAGASGRVAWSEAVDAGLDSTLADFVVGGGLRG